jgi:ABC-type transporter Mla maintaining outer membrane lipid asymmetry ATPase subunit MlaF
VYWKPELYASSGMSAKKSHLRAYAARPHTQIAQPPALGQDPVHVRDANSVVFDKKENIVIRAGGPHHHARGLGVLENVGLLAHHLYL